MKNTGCLEPFHTDTDLLCGIWEAMFLFFSTVLVVTSHLNGHTWTVSMVPESWLSRTVSLLAFQVYRFIMFWRGFLCPELDKIPVFSPPTQEFVSISTHFTGFPVKSRSPVARGPPSRDVTGKCRSAGGPDGLTVSRAPNAAGYVVERKVLRPQSGSI